MFSSVLRRRFDAGFFVRALLLSMFLMLLLMHMAAAQTATGRVDITPLWDTLTPYVLAIVGALVTWLIKIGDNFLQRHNCSILQDDFEQALQHAPAMMTAEMASLASHNQSVAVPKAIENVAAAMMQMVPGLVTQLKMPPATVQAFVTAKLNAVGHPSVTAKSS